MGSKKCGEEEYEAEEIQNLKYQLFTKRVRIFAEINTDVYSTYDIYTQTVVRGIQTSEYRKIPSRKNPGGILE